MLIKVKKGSLGRYGKRYTKTYKEKKMENNTK